MLIFGPVEFMMSDVLTDVRANVMIVGQTLTLTRDDSLSLGDFILIYNLIPDLNCQRQGNQPL